VLAQRAASEGTEGEVARCPSCSQNAHGETVLVRCAQLRATLATPLKRCIENWKSIARRPQWDQQRRHSRREKRGRERCQEQFANGLRQGAKCGRRERELRRLRQSVVRSQPFGEVEWVTAMVERFGLVSTIRNERRARKVLAENCS
jgi:predicted GTPase